MHPPSPTAKPLYVPPPLTVLSDPFMPEPPSYSCICVSEVLFKGAVGALYWRQCPVGPTVTKV